ncbi:MAG: alpha/beta hydrolase [Rhodoferax sp.]|nr:alpha/beta hydrolase [Rhodoferax sp.]
MVFSHANSFPASTYKLLFRSLRGRGFTVKAIEKFGHDPQYPVTNNWPHLVQQLCDFTQVEAAKAGQPVWLVGHSLGGYLSLMAAMRLPHLAKGLVLVDSPLLGGWKSSAVGLAKQTGLVGSFSPGAISKRRRNTWASVDEAFAHFRHKKAFAQWDEQVLQDYVNLGTQEVDGKRVLAFDRDVETAIYNGLPHNLERQLKRHPLQCPVHFIGGSDSEELRRVGLKLTQRVTGGRISMMQGSHLFPMEKPIETAAAIEAAIRSLETAGA